MRHNNGSSAPPVSVLIVDDNEDAAMSLTMLLEIEDISSAVANDAPTALQMLQAIRPVLMLIDIGLPGMSGVELARRLRELEHTRHATLIALTGRDADAVEEALTVFDQFWTKPFDPKKLLDEVKSIVARAEATAASAAASMEPVQS